MTTEQLMQPRYEVIADYPNSIIPKGNIVDDLLLFKIEFEKYPHLFRKLEWWEKRDVKDMPEYVKCIKTPDQKHFPDMIYKVRYRAFEWGFDENEIPVFLETNCYIPSTETEFLNFKKEL